MRVLIVNTSEKTGGAAVAASRLVEALINNGVKAKILVMKKQTPAIYVASAGSRYRNLFNFLYERLAIWVHNCFHKKDLFSVSIANTGIDITKTNEFKEADIIHLHWINQGMLSLKGIRKILNSGKPVVWTMHDMWECTAICHSPYTCENYKRECGNCQFLRCSGPKDLSYSILRKKQKILSGSKVQFVAVSNWLARKARESSLLCHQPITVIPNTISLSKFVLKDRNGSRSQLQLPYKYIIAFGAARIDAPVKGLTYLIEALAYLIDHNIIRQDDIHLVLFGGIKSQDILQDVPIGYTYMGEIKDEDGLSTIYSAANVVVSSSLSETFGQTLIEAQACGCLPVSFNNSGQTDIIEHKVNGFLADYLSVESLARGIEWGLKTEISRKELRNSVIRKYSEGIVAGKYIELYNNFAGIEA